MNFAIHKIDTGEITGFVSCPANHIEQQIKGGEDFYLDCPMTATHIIDGEPVTITPLADPAAALSKIRAIRNTLLTNCDWTQIPDAPLSLPQVSAWKVYRQALRDFPDTADPENPVWPVRP